MAERTINLVMNVSDPTADSQAVKLNITATSADMDAKIFVLHAMPDGSSVFECVSSTAQMREIFATPVATGEHPIPYYRANTINHDCRNYDEALELWDAIVSDVNFLLRDLKASDTLSEVTTLTITV